MEGVQLGNLALGHDDPARRKITEFVGEGFVAQRFDIRAGAVLGNHAHRLIGTETFIIADGQGVLHLAVVDSTGSRTSDIEVTQFGPGFVAHIEQLVAHTFVFLTDAVMYCVADTKFSQENTILVQLV